jgi:hypothetical protein
MTENSGRFYSVLLAFQHFAFKPMKSLEHATILTEEELTVMETALRKLAVSLRSEDNTKWPSLHELAAYIDRHVPPIL